MCFTWKFSQTMLTIGAAKPAGCGKSFPTGQIDGVMAGLPITLNTFTNNIAINTLRRSYGTANASCTMYAAGGQCVARHGACCAHVTSIASCSYPVTVNCRPRCGITLIQRQSQPPRTHVTPAACLQEQPINRLQNTRHHVNEQQLYKHRKQQQHQQQQQQEAEDVPVTLSWQLWLAVASLPCGPAFAEEALKYNPTGGEQLIKSLSGIAYIGLVGFFLYKVLNRRARTAREERIAGQGPIETPFTKLMEQARAKPSGKATPLTALIGAVQAGGIAFGLWVFTAKVEAIIGNQALPPGYTAANMAITVRTIILGLLYLVTFIFTANTLGLTALSVMMVVDPKSVEDPELPERPVQTGPMLPKVSVTSSPEDIRRAFKVVSQSSQGSSSSSSSSSGASGSSASGSSSSSAVQAGSGSASSSQEQ